MQRCLDAFYRVCYYYKMSEKAKARDGGNSPASSPWNTTYILVLLLLLIIMMVIKAHTRKEIVLYWPTLFTKQQISQYSIFYNVEVSE